MTETEAANGTGESKPEVKSEVEGQIQIKLASQVGGMY